MAGRPLAFSEKTLFGHLENPLSAGPGTGNGHLRLRPDRFALQDATGQMALLQFMLSGKNRISLPGTIHCDHLIKARKCASDDLERALEDNREVYDFLKAAAMKFGMAFWEPGSGIIHQVLLENYAFPGGMMIAADSHAPNAGGLGMFASGAGGSDIAEVMAGAPWEIPRPSIIGVRLTGKLSGWSSPKDVILRLLEILKVDGGTNRVIEYFGEGAGSISCTGKATIANMGAELGATSSVFPFDDRMSRYLRANGRIEAADLAEKNIDLLTADEEILDDPERYLSQVVEIDLSSLSPRIAGPHSPDLVRELSGLRAARTGSFPSGLSACLIGSCADSSYEDMSRAAEVLKSALSKGLKLRSPLFVSPGSERVRKTLERDGIMEIFVSSGATVLPCSCGPCIGQWERLDGTGNEANSIATSYNRNFRGRNDGNPETSAFLASPEICVAMALAGRPDFDPSADRVSRLGGEETVLDVPSPVPDLAPGGFADGTEGCVLPPEEVSDVRIGISPRSERLQLLEPFPPWDGGDFEFMPVLMKIPGRCTTDQISPAGAWIRFRGHLDRISDNLFLGAVNAFTGKRGLASDNMEGGYASPAAVARKYKRNGMRWVVIGDENYGEGSSREHAAMSPRHLGAAAVIARSFARIHETNLKKQGVLPLTFTDKADFDSVLEKDRVSILGLSGLSPGGRVRALLDHGDGKLREISLAHSLTLEQIGWFREGSAINALRQAVKIRAVMTF